MGWLLLLAASSAWAGKLGKAERGLEELEAGDERHLERTLEAIEAVITRRGGDDGAAWLLRGKLYHRLLGHPDLAFDPAARALESYEKAVTFVKPQSAAKEYDALLVAGLSEEVPALEAALVAELNNALEGKDWEGAERLLGLAQRARTADEALRGPTPAKEAPLRRLAIQLSTQLDRPEEASAHYARYLEAAGQDDIALACVVARSWVDQKKFEEATAFLMPLSERHPTDAVLLRTEVDLLLQSGRKEEAIHRIERVWASLSESVSGSVLAAQLFDSVGRTDRARVAWERVLDLDPHHVNAEIELGRLLTRMAVERRADLRARAEEFEQRRPSREVLTQLKAVVQLWTEAEAHLVAARAQEPASREALAAYVALYEAKIAGVDEEAATRSELAALKLDREKLETARTALAALGGS